MHVVRSIEGNLLEYSHLLFRARTGRKGSASSLVTAAFCLDPKALGGDVRWHWASKILQVSLGLLSRAWGAPCVPEFGSVPPAEHLRWQWECAHEHLSLSLQMISVPHNSVTSSLTPGGFSSFRGSFISCMPAKQKVLLGHVHVQTSLGVAECWRITLQLSVAPCVVLQPCPLGNP